MIGIVIVGQVAVLALSATATAKHLQSAAGRFTNVTTFHLAHTCFCATYVAYHIPAVMSMLPNPFISEICLCDPYNSLYIAVLCFYLMTWHEFLRYWKRATLKVGDGDERWQIRSVLYIGWSVYYGARLIIAMNTVPCSRDNFGVFQGIQFGVVIVLATAYIALDSADLSIACVRRYKSLKRTQKSSRAKYQVSLFVLLPGSMVCSAVVPLFTMYRGQGFLFSFPSMIMLGLM